MNPATRIPINANQSRHVAALLALLDETLSLFQEYARGREVRSVCYEERNRLTEEQRADLLATVSRMRSLMAELKTDLRLPARVEDVGKRIWGHSAGFFDSVAELEVQHLRGYGEVPPALEAYLAPRARALLNELQTLSGIGGEAGEKPRPCR